MARELSRPGLELDWRWSSEQAEEVIYVRPYLGRGGLGYPCWYLDCPAVRCSRAVCTRVWPSWKTRRFRWIHPQGRDCVASVYLVVHPCCCLRCRDRWHHVEERLADGDSGIGERVGSRGWYHVYIVASWMCHWAVIPLGLSVNQIYQKWPGNGCMLPTSL